MSGKKSTVKNGVLEGLFPGYYAPSERDLELLWSQATFVVDANLLLQLYGLPERTRSETLGALGKLKERLWMPYQVAVEFQRNRPRAIGQARDRVNKVTEPLDGALAQFEEAVAAVQLEKRGLDRASRDMKKLLSLGSSVIKEAKGALNGQVDLVGADSVREEISALYEDRIGAPPTQQHLNEMYAEAEKRYKDRMGPGFEDANKKDPTFRHGGIVYNRLYGDYVLWKQVIDHLADQDQVVDLVILTQDRKSDWWQKHNERLVGPHPEMCTEMLSEGKLERFWMYDLEEFLSAAGDRLSAKVSETTLSDVAYANAEISEYWKKAAEEIRLNVREMTLPGPSSDHSERLRALGVEPSIFSSYYSAGETTSTPGSWGAVTSIKNLGVMHTGMVLRELARKIHSQGGEKIHFYCSTPKPPTEFDRSSFKGFISDTDDMEIEPGLTIFFYFPSLFGKYKVVEVKRY
ncbi:PIN-like domain-containing protein [Stenotrophomonas sp. TWI273]|uniref:PIN-like domain-containing protein n=1 Tax=Stenotrophomonas sp. TWI273 TaxID=3136774 RepID=UPI003208C4EB